MERKIISAEEIGELREQAKENNPAVKVINLNDIALDEHSIISNTVKYKGTTVRVGDDFIREFANILNVNVKLQRNLTGDDEMGKDMFVAMLNALKMFNARKRVPQVTLVGDTNTGMFTNVVSGDFARISNEGLFDVAKTLMKNHKGLEMIETKLFKHSPDVMLKLLAPQDHKLVESNDEIFNFGLTLSNSAVNTFIGDFAYRLVCTNGMMGMRSENNFKLHDIGTKGLLDMHGHLNEASERHFMPVDFEANINTAQSIEASFAEVEQAFNYIKGQLNVLDDQKDRVQASIGFRYFKEYFDTIDRLKRKGVQLADLDKKQKQFIPSGMKMMDLINNITFLGSNHIGVEFKNMDKLQVYGGKLMTKDADLKFAKYLNY